MTTLSKYKNQYYPVKYFLSSYRALSDGEAGIGYLEDCINKNSLIISEWKVLWIGSCTILRTAIDLFKQDKKICISSDLRKSIANEWENISSCKDQHAVFWKFLRHERNNILHEYKWNTYETWMSDKGETVDKEISLLSIPPENHKSVLIMKNGHYEGQDALDLIKQSSEWVRERIYSAIANAGLDPEEKRNAWNFSPKPKNGETETLPTLLT